LNLQRRRESTDQGAHQHQSWRRRTQNHPMQLAALTLHNNAINLAAYQQTIFGERDRYPNTKQLHKEPPNTCGSPGNRHRAMKKRQR
jgi:hypothetical protein